MSATHRESRHGTGAALRDGLVVGVHIVDDIHEALLHRGFRAPLVEGVSVGGVHALVPPSGRCVARGVAVGHHHNHRHTLALGDEVVHNLRRASEVAPRRLVATVSVQQIHHGEALLAVILRWQIDRHAPLLAECRAVVPHSAEHSVGNIVHRVEMSFVVVGLRDDKDVAQRRDVAVHIAVGGVDESLSVHRQAVRIEFRGERGCRDGPHAILLFCHVQPLAADFLEVAVHAHRLCRGVVEVERHGAVLVDDGRCHPGPLAQGLLSEAAQRHEEAARKNH